MEDYKVVKYSSSNYKEWNDFLDTSRNATFLFHRDFMEYHSDRFRDFSLLVYRKNKLITILPANLDGELLYSHQGLSYGGFLLPNKVAFKTVFEALKCVLVFLERNDIKKIILKQIPKIYCNKPSDDLDYLMFILKAKLFRRDLSMTIKLDKKNQYSTLRKRKIKKAQNLKFVDDTDLPSFWNLILIPNLKKKFNVKPVHSLEEITRLKQTFPYNIKQFNVFDDDGLLAGCTVFETEKVAHLQYVSTKKNIKDGALDFLIHQLLTTVYKNKTYFDFGISNENQGKNINLGLLNWKQSFGASPIVHDFYEIKVNSHPLLNNVML
ncbi:MULTISPECIES: GNAT family N-acetyltransferase [Hwangdonia]|uniref:GNAT family N-acetyltransferase n=1 Tax=Hwangdonia seohaensis TaxID=1240727 RepID=A0ABW3RFN8_9FLAO|nr:GNAT family N-acetyltransferase [Hwangdonia seohaensis]